MNTENTDKDNKANQSGADTASDDCKVVEEQYKEKKSDEAGDEIQSLKDVIIQNATEDDAPISKNLTLKKILGGDILTAQVVRKQIWVFLLIALFSLIYISNRYSCQQDLIEINKLQEQLLDAKYKALSSSSQMTEKSRESNVLEMLKNNKDSLLKAPNQPPYIITVPEEQ